MKTISACHECGKEIVPSGIASKVKLCRTCIGRFAIEVHLGSVIDDPKLPIMGGKSMSNEEKVGYASGVHDAAAICRGFSGASDREVKDAADNCEYGMAYKFSIEAKVLRAIALQIEGLR